MAIARVYLDNCCFNRPFDDQSQLRVHIETEAKLEVQALMRAGVLEYVWSGMLESEVCASSFHDRIDRILSWSDGAAMHIDITPEIGAAAAVYMSKGLKPADATHVACAVAAGCDWFLTVDKGILSKMHAVDKMRIGSPVDFIVEVER